MKAIFSVLLAAASLSLVSCSCYGNSSPAPKKECTKKCKSKACCPVQNSGYVAPVYVNPAK